MTMTIFDARGRKRATACPGADTSAALEKGCVALLRRGRKGTVEVRFRPGVVKPLALLRAVRWLDDHDCDRCVFDPGIDGRPVTVLSPLEAMGRIVILAEDAQSRRKGDFKALRHPWGAPTADARLGQIRDAWQASRGNERHALMAAVRAASCGRYLEIVPHDGASRLEIGAVGDGYSLYGRGWRSMAVGGRFEDMPDYAYARWAAEGYRDAYRAGEPLVEDIAATVRLPGAAALRLTYRRVIMPLGNVLLGATLGQTVDSVLGLEAGDEPGDVLQ
jgi:hypothetical protein